MCWNREVSLVTGTTATALSVYLLMYGKGNDIPIALVSLTIALMQFAEAWMWESTNIQDPTSAAEIATRGGRIGVLALFLQPLALGLGVAWARKWPGIAVAFTALWCSLAIPTLLPLLKREWPIQKTGNCGHLQWTFLEPMLKSPFAGLYWAVMLGAWILLKPASEGLWYSAMAMGTFALTWKLFPGEWGSLWCFIANLLPLGRIL